MAGDLPVMNVVTAGDIIEGITSQISRPVNDEPLITHRSTSQQKTWPFNIKMASNKIHISAPESLETPLRNDNNVPAQPSQPPPSQPPVLLLDILNSLPQMDSHETVLPTQGIHQDGFISTAVNSTSNELLQGILTDSTHGIAGGPPSDPLPMLAEDDPLSSPVSTIQKLQRLVDRMLFGSQVHLL